MLKPPNSPVFLLFLSSLSSFPLSLLLTGGLDWVHICRASSKVITFIDLAGHEKYLKTTIFGMTGHAPDFCMLMVGANAGIIGMTKGGH